MHRRFLPAVVLLWLCLPFRLGECGLATAAGAESAEKKAEPKADKEGKPPATADRISFDVTVEPKEVRRGETFKLTITGKLKPGYYTYPRTQRTSTQPADQVTKVKFEDVPGLRPLWPVRETEPELVNEKVVGYLLKHKSDFTWTQDVLVLPDAKPGPAVLPFSITIQVCSGSCVTGTHHLEAQVVVKDGPPAELTADLSKRLKEKEPEVKVVPVPGSGDREVAGKEESGLLGFILQGIFWGAVSLITPCVFPMIPITVSFFLKQSEKAHHRPVTMAAVYCLTIVVVLTIAAVAWLSFFRALSTNPVMNIGIGLLFIFFALSLFGMYDIELPSGLARFTSARESRGGLVGTMFMALTFTIISFACVAPFLGGFGGTANTSQLTLANRVAGGLAFATTFASPFLILALFPSLLKGMPKSGNWLNGVKVVMGFLEFAAALKFLRAGELVLLPTPLFFTYDLVLGLYVALSVLCGLYLLNVYRLPHDTPTDHLSVPRLVLSCLFLGLGLYLAPALFKAGPSGDNQRPSGVLFAWLDSFLLPDHGSDLPWKGDLDKGLAEALTEKRLVFVDFTGVTCTNCSINEKTVFTKPEVADLLRKYSLVQLYTDRVPNKFYSAEEREKFGNGVSRQVEDAGKNLRFQREEFNTEQLPLYVILQPLPDGKYKEVARYAEGKINDDSAFIRFLEKPLAAYPGVKPTEVAEK